MGMVDPCPVYLTNWWEYHLPVGTSIAILALIGVLVPLFRPWEKIARIEKALWTLLMIALLALELRTLSLDRQEHVRDQALAECHQLESLKTLVGESEKAMTLSQTQYGSTIGHVDGVLKTTQNVAKLSQENLEEVTGGDSYSYVYPLLVGGTNEVYDLRIHNAGKHILTGVVVKVRFVAAKIIPTGEILGKAAVYQVGVLPPEWGELIPDSIWTPTLNANGTSEYDIRITSQNGGSREKLFFRPSASIRGASEYRIEVTTEAFGKRRPQDLRNGSEWYRTRMSTDWVESDKQPEGTRAGGRVITRRRHRSIPNAAP